MRSNTNHPPTTQLSPEHDIIVVSAGLAGAATAMLLARHGLRILLLEQLQPGAVGFETEVLTRAGVLLLSRWGALEPAITAGTPPVRRMTFRYGDETVNISIKPSLGIDALYAPARSALEADLRRGAFDAGAEPGQYTEIVDLMVCDGRVVGLHAGTVDGRVADFSARLVIGADGAASSVARLVDAKVVRRAAHRVNVTYGYWSGLATDAYEWTFGVKGRAAMIPTAGGGVCVFASAPPERIGRGGAEVIADVVAAGSGHLAERLATGSPFGTVRTWNAPRGHVRSAGGPGWALVGAAGYFKDPSSVHGFTDALRDAELLARVVGDSFGDDALLDEALTAYEAARDRIGMPIFDIVDRIAGQQWDESEIAHLLQQLSSAMADEVEMLVGLEPGRLS